MTSKMPISFSKVISNNLSASESVCEKIIAELGDSGFNQDDIFAVHLALGEAFLNSVIHGNQMDADKKIRVEYLISSDKVEISVSDEGEGFNPDLVPDPRYGENLYKIEGRGLLIIKSYMDVVKFNEQCNRIEMIRHKGGAGPRVDKNT
ncbi:ATP-binding protein [Planctomycetota bacterium]